MVGGGRGWWGAWYLSPLFDSNRPYALAKTPHLPSFPPARGDPCAAYYATYTKAVVAPGSTRPRRRPAWRLTFGSALMLVPRAVRFEPPGRQVGRVQAERLRARVRRELGHPELQGHVRGAVHRGENVAHERVDRLLRFPRVRDHLRVLAGQQEEEESFLFRLTAVTGLAQIDDSEDEITLTVGKKGYPNGLSFSEEPSSNVCQNTMNSTRLNSSN